METQRTNPEASKGEYLGRFINKWRERSVAIYADKADATFVITVGEPFDKGRPVVICRERRADYDATLRRIAEAEKADRGVYIYE